MGANVTQKTDIGDYVVEKSGDITVYAGQSITLEPGFSVEYGADFHAFIAYDDCRNPGMVINNKGDKTQDKAQEIVRSTSVNLLSLDDEKNTASQLLLFPNPNKGEFTLQLPENQNSGKMVIFDIYGKAVFSREVHKNKVEIHLNLPQGIYFLHYMNTTQVQTLQFVVQ